MKRGLFAVFAGVVGLFGLVACGGGSSESEVPSSSSSKEAVDLSKWNPHEWKPTVKVSLPVMSDSEKRQWLRSYLANLARSDNISNPPEGIEPIRFATSRKEYHEELAACLTDRGFNAKAGPDGGTYYSPGVPDSQTEALNLAWYECNALYPPDPAFVTDWNEDQLALVYDYWTQYYTPCMADAGYTVDNSKQPTKELFIEKFFTPDRINWWPSNFSGLLPMDEQWELVEHCPPYPPDEFMYGVR
ncbi:hypothetical protein [Trueperella sp. LYQ141]|uniref:hypothetical protein n=1 Tax=Trueperella sp. LYQ141 TaxID=3391058 RepID=UPI0039832351